MTMQFSYDAFTAAGRRVSGRIDADTKAQALDKLMRQSLIPASIEDAREKQTTSVWRKEIRLGRRVGLEARAGFARELALLLKAGIALDRSLLLMTGTGSGLAPAIGRVRERVLSGKPLQAALAAEAGLFAGDELAMIGAGERSGDVGAALSDLAAALERRAELAARLSSALVYPAVLLVMALAAIAVIVTVLVPHLEPLFEGTGSAPPWPVAVLLWLSHAVSAHWIALLGAVVALGVALVGLIRQPQVRLHLSAWLFRMPLAGGIAAQLDSARFARSLAILIRAGTPLLQALTAAGEACRNPAGRVMAARTAERVAAGQRLAPALEAFPLLSGTTRQFIAIGEEANRLEDMLLHAAHANESAAHRRIERMMTLLTPLLTLLIGGLVGGLIVSVMRAILSVNELVLQ